jgi:Flp pilus assembly protein TadB
MSHSLRQRWNDRPARRRRALVAALPDALDAVARGVRSGSTLRLALARRALPTFSPRSLATFAAAAARLRVASEELMGRVALLAGAAASAAAGARAPNVLAA